jgi:tetratricopeptide (TPR) repeat protein
VRSRFAGKFRRGAICVLIAGLPACAPRETGVGGKAARSPLARIETPRETATVLVAPSGSRLSTPRAACWFGVASARGLAVVLTDGRLAVYRPELGTRSIAVADPSSDRATCLSGMTDGAIVSGDSRGAAVWRVGASKLELISRLDCGPVVALVGAPGDEECFAATDDGRILRLRFGGPKSQLRVTAEHRFAGGLGSIARLGLSRSSKVVRVFARDGRVRELLRDLTGSASETAPAIDVVESPRGWRARLSPGPTLEIDWPGGVAQPLRFGIGRPAHDLAVVDSGRRLLTACDGQVLSVDLSNPRTIRPTELRAMSASDGTVLIASDPDDPDGQFLVADSTGRMALLSPKVLAARSRPRSLAEIPEFAFQPHRRLYRTSDDARGDATHHSTLETLRSELDRGDAARALGSLREWEADSTGSASDRAEMLVMLAAAEQELGGPATTIDERLLEASRLFNAAGRADREADVRLWQASLLLPALDSLPSLRDPAVIEKGLLELDRLLAPSPNSQRSRVRRDAIMHTYQAWALLNLGETALASISLRAAMIERPRDLVLSQAAEIDRAAAALSAARGDWPLAADADARVLSALTSTDRPALRRAAARARLHALAAQSLWAEVAALTPSSDDRADAEWTLHRATAQARARTRPAAPSEAARTPAAIHFKARFQAQAGELERAAEGFERAANEHADARLEDLELEAILERAEVLERLGKTTDAVALFGKAARALRPGTTDALDASRPIRAATGRAYRGLARGLLALDRPQRALSALEQGDLADWFRADGEALVRSAGLGVPSDPAQPSAALRKSRSENGPASGAARTLERELQNSNRILALGDPEVAFDVQSLHLESREASLVFAPVGPKAIYGFVLRGDEVARVKRLPLSRAELRRAIWSWRKSLGDQGRGLVDREEPLGLEGLITLSPEPNGPSDASPEPLGPTWGGYLEDALIRPFADVLNGVDHLYVVPRDDLGALPLEAVGRSSRVGEQFQISYLPNLSIFQALRAEGRATSEPAKTTTIIADAADRARYLSAALAPDAAVTFTYLGADASRDRLFAAKLAPSGLVFLNAAGRLDRAKAPSGAVGLKLPADRPGTNADGLTCRDLLRLGMKSHVLVLDPTDRADRDAVRGIGLSALARATMAAGADWLVLMLWDAPEESKAVWAAEFHRAISDGAAPPEALQKAKLAVARDLRFRNPVHWAGYVLYGAK